MDKHWTREGKRYRLTLSGLRSAVTTWRWPGHSVSETLQQIGFEPYERPRQ